MIVITKIIMEDELGFLKDMLKSSEGKTEEQEEQNKKKKPDFVFKDREVEEIGKDKVLELKFEFYMAKVLSYIVT